MTPADDTDLVASFSGFESGPSDAELRSVAQLAADLRAAEEEAVRATETLRKALDRVRALRDDELPRALERAGTRAFTTESGLAVALRTRYDARKLTSAEGINIVEDFGGAALIKTVVTLEFDRGDKDKALEVIQALRENRHANAFRVTLEESVHNQTLGAFVRELVEVKRLDPPLDKLGVHRSRFAVVGTPPKSVELKGLRR